MRQFVRRARRLHDELVALADLRNPSWWLVAAGAALEWRGAHDYVASDADAASDTFIGTQRADPADPLALAHAARQAIRELDGTLPDQPLAVTVLRTDRGAQLVPSTLSTVAFAIGDRVIRHRLAATLADEPPLQLERDTSAETPFVCISLGDEPIETARHGHRRAWRDDAGPWLGLGRAAGLDVVSTCHLIVDGHGHAALAARIATGTGASYARYAERGQGNRAISHGTCATSACPSAVPSAVPLRVAWREIPTGTRTLPLTYAIGRVLREPGARFSPTLMLPIAGVKSRVIPALASVRFDGDTPEPYGTFATRVKRAIEREASGEGPYARLLGVARGLPIPLAWKRSAIAAERPRWLEPLVNVIGGRACISRIRVDTPMPLACAVSSPSQLATARDPLGSCVVTVVDDGTRASITLCGSGESAAPERLDALLEVLQGI